MSNEQNLKPLSSEEARKNGRKGGIASGKARRAKKTMKEQMQMILDMPVTSKQVKDILTNFGIKDEEQSRQMQLVVSLFQKAVGKGVNSIGAYKEIMALIEDKSEEKTDLNNAKEILVKIKEVADEDNRT